MKIAFISFEYPPDTAYGGIATYVVQAARMLADGGHHVEVFTSSPHRSGTERDAGILVHRIQEADPRRFGIAIAAVFAERHAAAGFDVLEGPEYNADAREAVRLVPSIPLVVKLHTPSVFLLRLNYYERSLPKRLALYVGGIIRRASPAWGYRPDIEGYRTYVEDIGRSERAHARDADEIVSPSRALGGALIQEWGLDPARVVTIPYPFAPSPALLRIPADLRTNVVTFLGRLELRKGVLELARAIPVVLSRFPQVRFRFIGASQSSPLHGVGMREYLERQLSEHRSSVEFTGPIPYERLPEALAGSDICVFPSVWENFPFVCLEAMAAARGVVGSSAGGMAEMLDAGRAGRVVPPRNPNAIADAIVELLTQPELRMRLGRAARQRVLDEYGYERIRALREASYSRAVARRARLGARR